VVQNYGLFGELGSPKDLDPIALVKARRGALPVQIASWRFGKRTTPMPALNQEVKLAAAKGMGE